MRYASRFLDVAETRIHYLEWESDGPPILILHGNTHCGGVYAPLGERLQPDFHVLAVDLRGHGLSGRAGEYSWRQLRGDITQLIEALGLDDLLLVAHSRGGGVSLLTAAAMPGRVRGVVAYEPNIPVTAAARADPGRIAGLTERALRRRSTFESREDVYQHFRHRGAFAGWREEYFRAFVEHGVVECPGGGVELASPTSVEAQFYEAMRDVSPWEEIHDCPTPALLIYGERSGRLGAGADPLASVRPMFPNCDLSVMAECTHSGPMEQPDTFEARIRGFAARVPGLGR